MGLGVAEGNVVSRQIVTLVLLDANSSGHP